MLTDTHLRPCHTLGETPNACARAHYQRMIDNHVALHGAWEGWRLAGRDLVAPDRQRINPERLRGLLFRQAAEERLSKMQRQRNNGTPRILHCSIVAITERLPARERFDGLA